jgi:hypothetical protein
MANYTYQMSTPAYQPNVNMNTPYQQGMNSPTYQPNMTMVPSYQPGMNMNQYMPSTNSSDVDIVRSNQGVILSRDQNILAGVKTTGAINISNDSDVRDAAVAKVVSESRLHVAETELKIREMATEQNKGALYLAKIQISENELAEKEKERIRLRSRRTLFTWILLSYYCCCSELQQELFTNKSEIKDIKKQIKMYKDDIALWMAKTGQTADINFSTSMNKNITKVNDKYSGSGDASFTAAQQALQGFKRM